MSNSWQPLFLLADCLKGWQIPYFLSVSIVFKKGILCMSLSPFLIDVSWLEWAFY